MQTIEQVIQGKGLNALYSQYGISGKLIGKGSFGSVYAGFDKVTQQAMAIKILNEVPTDTIGAKQLFREMMLLRILKGHPHIISLENIVASAAPDGTLDAMAFVFKRHETDLFRVIHSTQPLSMAHVRFFLYQMLHGVAYIHSAGIVHRDLKPANILINSDCRLVICDFGLARATHDIIEPLHLETAAAPPKLYRKLTGYMVTRWYRSPEVIVFNSNGGEAPADMWSIGCILWDLIYRKSLFPASSNRELLRFIIHLLGMPEPDDMTWIEDQKVIDFINKQQRTSRLVFKGNLVHKGADKSALDLLQKLLAFNPSKRLTAEQALQDPFLSDLDPIYKIERPSHFPMNPLSTEEQKFLNDYYAFERASEGSESPALTKECFSLIQNEIQQYAPSAPIESRLANIPGTLFYSRQQDASGQASGTPIPDEVIKAPPTK